MADELIAESRARNVPAPSPPRAPRHPANLVSLIVHRLDYGKTVRFQNPIGPVCKMDSRYVKPGKAAQPSQFHPVLAEAPVVREPRARQMRFAADQALLVGALHAPRLRRQVRLLHRYLLAELRPIAGGGFTEDSLDGSCEELQRVVDRVSGAAPRPGRT